jgi:prevent-host-death family protein
MITIESTEMQNNFGSYFNKVLAGETISVSGGGRSAVLLSKDEYEELARMRRNAEYFSKLDRGLEDIRQGKGITVSIEELERMAE